MPTYEYRCKSCGDHLEVVQSFTDEALTECPACQGELRKVFGSIGISFKGSGFYKNDARPGTKKKKTSTESTANGSSSSESSGGSSSSESPKASGSGESSTTTTKPSGDKTPAASKSSDSSS